MMCAMFGDCLISYKMLTKFYADNVHFTQKIVIPTLKYLARYTGLNSIFDCIMQPQFSYCLICWFGFLAGRNLQTLLIARDHLAC